MLTSEVGRPRSRRRLRRGATVVEGTVVVLVTLCVLFGMLDLGIAVLHYNSLSEGVRRVPRAAIVHGERAAPEAASWGPEPFESAADAPSDIAAAMRPALAALDPAEVLLRLEWIDGGNADGQRVRVTASHSYQPVVPFVLGTGPIELRAQSTMMILH